jgi:outer membrane protein assembly factor BamB
MQITVSQTGRSAVRLAAKVTMVLLFAAGGGCTGSEPASEKARPAETQTVSAGGTVESGTVNAADWTGFRGPHFGSATAANLPLEWGPDEGILWKSGLPGRGASTPVISGQRIYVTAYDGFGLAAEDSGDYRHLRHHLLCLDRMSGQPLWHREITGTGLRQKMNPELARHGFASSTPVTDGDRVFAFFGVTGVFAFDRNGDLLWQRNLGLDTHYFGSSASPLIHDNMLIVNASLESDAVYALDRDSGAVVWEIPDIHECWSMPVLGKNAEGQTEMVISSKNTVAGFDPATGQHLWHCPGIQDYVVSVPVIHDGICYLTGGKTKQTMAIRLGGRGDVSQSHKLWEVGKVGSNVSSPVFHDGRLYIFHDSGLLQVLDAATGKLIHRQRTATRDRPFASPLLAGDLLYMPFQDCGIGVFRADEQGTEVALQDRPDDLPLMASIVPAGDHFYYRNDRYLYCVRAGQADTVTIPWSQPADHELVVTRESCHLDPEKGWSRRYLGFLDADFEKTIRLLLMPYQSVITEQQTIQARERIMGVKPRYDALRQRFQTLRREELATPAEQLDQFRDRYAELEAETKQLNHGTRILVKQLFPDEQLQQHYRDAEAGIAHLKPEGQPKKRQTPQ